MINNNTCYLCQSVSTEEQHDQISICDSCSQEHPYLTAGIQANINDKKMSSAYAKLGQGIGWYSVIGTFPYVDDDELSPIVTDQNHKAPTSIITKLESRFRKFGAERTLTYLLAHTHLSDSIRYFDDNTLDEAGLPPQMFRFAFGLIMSTEMNVNTRPIKNPIDYDVSCFPDEYLRIVNLLRQAISAFGSDEYLQNVAGVDSNTVSERLVKLPKAVQNRELFISRTAYHRQYLQAMERQYTPFQRDFFDKYGIDINESVKWSKQIVNEIENRKQELIAALTEYRNSILRVIGGYVLSTESGETERYEEYMSSDEYKRLRRREIANWNIVVNKIRDQFWVTQRELKSFTTNSNSKYFDRYLDVMSTGIGDGSLSSPYDHNKMDEAPLIKLNSNYLLPRLPRLGYALSQRFYYLLADENHNLHCNFGNTWGDIIELWATNRIARIVDSDRLTHSVNYETSGGEDGEIDILVRIGDQILVGEVKSKRLPAKARKGSLEEIKDSTASKNEGIGKAVKQLNNATEALKNIGGGTKIKDTVPFSLDPGGIDRYESMIITATHYDQVATREFPALFDEYDIEDLPYMCSVYSLDAMAEVLESKELIDYVGVRRNELSKQRAFAAGDELDFLEAFKSDQLQNSMYPLPPKEESEKHDVYINRSIYNIDAGVNKAVGNKYGFSFSVPIDEY